MARMLVTLTVEHEMLDDAIADLRRVEMALVKRHGSAFRVLERKIEHLIKNPALLKPESHDLEPGRIVLTPPTSVQAILAEARRIGVI